MKILKDPLLFAGIPLRQKINYLKIQNYFTYCKELEMSLMFYNTYTYYTYVFKFLNYVKA